MITIKSVKKRNGNTVDFDEKKIGIAVLKALKEVNEFKEDITSLTSSANRIADSAVKNLAIKLTTKDSIGKVKFDSNNATLEDVDIELIQDSVEDSLMGFGYHDTARSYITYRYQHAKNRETAANLINIDKAMGEYLNGADWRVKENSNIK